MAGIGRGQELPPEITDRQRLATSGSTFDHHSGKGGLGLQPSRDASQQPSRPEKAPKGKDYWVQNFIGKWN